MFTGATAACATGPGSATAAVLVEHCQDGVGVLDVLMTWAGNAWLRAGLFYLYPEMLPERLRRQGAEDHSGAGQDAVAVKPKVLKKQILGVAAWTLICVMSLIMWDLPSA